MEVMVDNTEISIIISSNIEGYHFIYIHLKEKVFSFFVKNFISKRYYGYSSLIMSLGLFNCSIFIVKLQTLNLF